MEGSRRSTRVVVIGGGPAGSLIARTLQFVADVVLIDPKEYFEVPWAALRCAVEPKFAERSLINHKEYLTNARLVTSTAVDLTEREIITANGRWISYDYLVIATGHPTSVPLTRTERLKQFKEAHEQMKSANSVLIIGGGPTGVELAGEIASDFPAKQVTLVHKGLRLVEFIGSKASAKTFSWLTSKNVKVLLNQEITVDQLNSKQTEFVTTEGTKVQADCWFNCTGKELGSSWLREGILKDRVNKQGQVMVDEHLRVLGTKTIFAIGDINDTAESKQGYIAQKHAILTAKNIKLLIKGGKESHLSSYKPASTMAIVSLGRKEAVAQLPFFTAIGHIPGMLKSKDLFIGKTRRELGLDPDGI
ncbi:uncharacterized protein LOC116266972 [Nymphaea colorata]|nr:uncharacterized protein LOC116266972 [Nymphaea colorata]